MSDKYDEPCARGLCERYYAIFGGVELLVRVESIAEDLLGLGVEARNGCVPHACTEQASYPKTNAEHRRVKLKKNRERDADTGQWLVSDRWVAIQEHEVPNSAADRVGAAVAGRRHFNNASRQNGGFAR